MSLRARIAQAEAALGTSEDEVHHYVCMIGEPAPEGLRPQDTIVWLPRKAASPEEWYEQVRQEFGYLMDGLPHHSPGL